MNELIVSPPQLMKEEVNNQKLEPHKENYQQHIPNGVSNDQTKESPSSSKGNGLYCHGEFKGTQTTGDDKK